MMIDLEIIIEELDRFYNVHCLENDRLNKFSKCIIEDAKRMITNVISDYGFEIESKQELAKRISKNRYEYLDLTKFVELISSCSIDAEICTDTIYKRYLSDNLYNAYKNEDPSFEDVRKRMIGYRQNMTDIYLEAKSYAKAWQKIERIIDDIEEFKLTH